MSRDSCLCLPLCIWPRQVIAHGAVQAAEACVTGGVELARACLAGNMSKSCCACHSSCRQLLQVS